VKERLCDTIPIAIAGEGLVVTVARQQDISDLSDELSRLELRQRQGQDGGSAGQL
jgi:hypothetical protein